MTVSADVLKNAFAAFEGIGTTVEVDLGKVARSVVESIDSVRAAPSADSLAALSKRLDEVSGVLDLATVVGGTEEVLAPATEVAKRYAAEKAKKGGKDKFHGPEECPEDDEDMKRKKAAASAAAPAPVAPAPVAPAAPVAPPPAPAGTEKQDGPITDGEVSKAVDKDGWASDMAPEVPPTRLSERLTADERIVPAREGGREVQKRLEDKRSAAFSKRRGPADRQLR